MSFNENDGKDDGNNREGGRQGSVEGVWWRGDAEASSRIRRENWSQFESFIYYTS